MLSGRGAVSNYRRDEHASRIQVATQIQRRIRAELELRRQPPATVATETAADHLPAWLAPLDVMAHQDTPALWKKEVTARRELMANEVTRLGAQLAAEPPASARCRPTRPVRNSGDSSPWRSPRTGIGQ
jgi:hypothetical protein